MYIYFDKSGSIKEIVNDEALRQGNNNANVIYCYFEGTTQLSFSRVDFSILRNGDTSAITYTEDNDSPITVQVPYNADRQLLRFKYYKDYPFHKYTLTATNLALSGVIKITITAYDTNNKVFAMGTYIGEVENGVLNYDTDITEAQYQSLLNMLAQHARRTDIENYVGATREQVTTKTNFMQYYNGVRVYDTLALANADIANLALLSVVLIKNENDDYVLYRKKDTTTLVKVSLQATPIDLSNYYTKTEIDTKTNAYQVALDAEIRARIEAINTINQTTYETTYYNANNEVVKNYDTLGKIKS